MEVGRYGSQDQIVNNIEISQESTTQGYEDVDIVPTGLTANLNPFIAVLTVIAGFYVITEFEKMEGNGYIEVVLSILVVIVTVGIGTLVFYSVLFFKSREEAINIHFPAKRLNRHFLISLGLMSLGFYGLQIWNIGTCIHTNRGMGAVLIIYHLLLFIFTCIEMISLQKFVTTHPFQYKNRIFWMRNNIFKMIILAANLSIWLNSHSVIKFTPVLHGGHIEDHHNGTKNETSESTFSECTMKSKFFNFEVVFTVFHIGFLEFFLHSLSVFIEIWSEDDINDKHDDVEIDQGNAFFGFNTPKCLFRIILAFFTVLSSWFLVICLVQMLQQSINYDIEFAHRIYDCVFGVLMLILVLAFCKLIYKPINRVYPLIRVEFKANDYLYIVSYFGLIVNHVFELHAGVKLGGRFSVTIFTSLVYILLDLLQTLFLVKACKLAKETSVLKGDTLRMVCLILSRMNYGCWLRITFCVVISSSLNSSEVESFGELWESYSSIFLTLTAYYRFMSVFRYNEIVGITSRKDQPSQEMSSI